MNKAFSTLLLLVLSGAVLYLFRAELMSGVHMIQARDMFVREHSGTFTPGPAIGSRFPGLRAERNGIEVTLLEDFAGENGTLLVLDHDPDLSPFARRNLYSLVDIVQELRSAGINLVALLPAPASPTDRGISGSVSYPVLHDHREGLSVRTLGLGGGQSGAGDDQRVPQAGALLVNAQGNVVGNLFLADPSKRIAPRVLLRYAQSTLSTSNDEQ